MADTLIAGSLVPRRGCLHVRSSEAEELLSGLSAGGCSSGHRYGANHRGGGPREIGVGEQLLGRWVAVERSRSDDPPGALDADERAELERLRAENAELRMDREFLKKAAAFFVTENQNR